MSGLFQARLAPEVGLLERTGRGLVFADLPEKFGRAPQAIADLEWMLGHADAFPPGLRRGAWRGLASAYAKVGRSADAERARTLAGPDPTPFLTDHSVNATDGFRFVPRELRELAGGIFVATGYDFADIGFVLVDGGVVAIDAGTTEATAADALAALRAKTQAPIRAVIVTHAHWDHIGGLGAFAGPGVEVIAQAGYPEELHAVNTGPIPFHYFFGAKAATSYAFAPTRTVAAAETVVIGGRRFGLHPAHGGETDDALLVH